MSIERLESAIEIFGHGFCATRAIIHPRKFKSLGHHLWVFEDDPPRKQDPRSNEFVGLLLEPEELRRAVDAYSLAPSRICSVHDGLTRPKDQALSYKSAGLRKLVTEPFFDREINRIEAAQEVSGISVRRVEDINEIERIHKENKRRLVPLSHPTDPDRQMILFGAWDGEDPLGWVVSVRVGTESSWVASLWVNPAHRRKGVGAALMLTMLSDDYQRGIRRSVLLASSAGAMLYPRLGYNRIGTLEVYSRAPIP